MVIMEVIQPSPKLTSDVIRRNCWEGRKESWYAADGLLHLKLTDLVGRKARRRAYLHRYSHRYELDILHLIAAPRSRSNEVTSDESVIHMDPWQDDLAYTQPV